MIIIRQAQMNEYSIWIQFDHHLSKESYIDKVNRNQNYVLFEDDVPIGILRYSLFWDEIPFCDLLVIDQKYQGKGYGKYLMNEWENQMNHQGFEIVLTSTHIDEQAQYFTKRLDMKMWLFGYSIF